MKFKSWMLLAMACLALAGISVADEPAVPEGMPMPEMGPPKEMKELASLEGTWDVQSKFNMSMDPKVEQWMETKSVAVFSYILDGGAMQCTYEGDPMMPGTPPFKGFLLQSWDRETKQWQAVWIDNMAGRVSLYTGTTQDGTTVLTGEDKMGGMTWLTRISTTNKTPTQVDWKMEYSMDGGKTWALSGSSVYTKRG